MSSVNAFFRDPGVGDALRAVIGELESSNAELHSRNEALQGATEELEASNEELRAGNEELRTVNEALQAKTDELVRLNALLNASEQRMALAQDAAHAGTWEWVLDGNRNVWSESLWALYGLKPGQCEPSYQAWADAVHPADRARVGAAIGAAAAAGEEFEQEWRVAAPPGAPERWLMSRGRPILGPTGRPERYIGIGIVIDITERKRTERALADSEARSRALVETNRKATTDLAAERRRLRTLIDAVPDLIWLKDPRGVFLFCNRPFEGLLGAPEAQIVGRSDRDFVPAEVADAFLADDRRAIESGHLITTREWLTFADDGHQALHETIKTPIYDPRARCWACSGSRVTSRP